MHVDGYFHCRIILFKVTFRKYKLLVDDTKTVYQKQRIKNDR